MTSEPAPPAAPRVLAAPSTRRECRSCEVVCDRVVYPSACIAQRCPALYAYDAPAGRRFVGCVHRVFAAEIDLTVLGPADFGALKCARDPLPVCRTEVERAYEHREGEAGCLNPEFAEPPSRDSFRVFARI